MFGTWLWSSTEFSVANARNVNVNNGNVNNNNKNNSNTNNRVRAFAELVLHVDTHEYGTFFFNKRHKQE